MTGLMRSAWSPQPLDQRVELVRGALADEHVDVALALEQPLDEMPADEAGGAGDEVASCSRTLPGPQAHSQRPARALE